MKALAACHIHSDWSYDGSWPIERLAAEFARRGYNVLLMTEHDRGFSHAKFDEYRAACRRASSPEMLVVPGIEYSDATNTVHILTWGNIPFLGEAMPTSTVLDEVILARGVSVFAHPRRRNAWRQFDPAWSGKLLGVEVWNRKTDGWRPSDKVAGLVDASGAIPFVSLDFHERNQFFPLTMVLDLESAASEASVVECLRARRCHPTAFGITVTDRVGNMAAKALALPELVRRTGSWMRRKVNHTAAPKVANRARA
jgi:hypothetical protein